MAPLAVLTDAEKKALRDGLMNAIRAAMPWKPSKCKVNGRLAYRLERQTGPCLRDNYEFACGKDGEPMEFRSSQEAEIAAQALND